MLPDMNTPNMLFGGVKFSDIPICHIKSSKNNTILQVTKVNGKFLFCTFYMTFELVFKLIGTYVHCLSY